MTISIESPLQKKITALLTFFRFISGQPNGKDLVIDLTILLEKLGSPLAPKSY
jgi:hypothetical protein